LFILNPIELIWGDLKGFVGHDNSTFKGEDVKALINKGFTQIDSAKWLHACEHVKKYIEQMFWKSDAIHEEIEKIINFFFALEKSILYSTIVKALLQ
jgi:predicted transcriptional regulator